MHSVDTRFDDLFKTRDRDHAILSKIDEGLEKLGAYRTKEQGKPPGERTGKEGWMDFAKDIRDIAKDFGLAPGGDNTSLDSIKMKLGERVLDGVMESASKRISTVLGTETAAHVTLKE